MKNITNAVIKLSAQLDDIIKYMEESEQKIKELEDVILQQKRDYERFRVLQKQMETTTNNPTKTKMGNITQRKENSDARNSISNLTNSTGVCSNISRAATRPRRKIEGLP